MKQRAGRLPEIGLLPPLEPKTWSRLWLGMNVLAQGGGGGGAGSGGDRGGKETPSPNGKICRIDHLSLTRMRMPFDVAVMPPSPLKVVVVTLPSTC
eukprot:scaffold11424_cov65-Phaeocystis_antarctica.AAC.1